MEKVTLAERLRLALPETPVDQFTFQWWTFETEFGIHEHRAVYYIDTPCVDVIGRDGANFRDDWALFDDGSIHGRWTGWSAPVRHMDYFTRYFATKDEALQAHILFMLRRHAQLTAERSEIANLLLTRGVVPVQIPLTEEARP